MGKLKAIDPNKRRQRLVRQHINPWGKRKERKRATLALQFISEVEAALPGASGNEKKAWVKSKLDDIFALPPIAEEISDFIISLTVECAYAGVMAAKKRGNYNDDLADAKKEIKSLKAKVKRLEKKITDG